MGPDTGLEFVEILNASDTEADLTGYELKLADSNYFMFPVFVLPPGARVIVHNNLDGTNTDTELYTGSLENMGNTHNSLALFSGAHTQHNIVDFVQYGDGGQQWESAAVSAGIWTGGDFAPDVDEGDSLNLYPDGQDTDRSSDWCACFPSFLAENCLPTPSPTNPPFPSPSPTTDPGTPTSTPTGQPTPRMGIMINEVFSDPEGADTGLEFIELHNSGDTPADLTGYDLKPDDSGYYTFPPFVLNSGANVIVHVNTSGTDTETDLFTGPDANMGNTSGFVVLFDSDTHGVDTIVDYMEYGAGGQSWESAAVSAGIWTAGDFAGSAPEGMSLNLCPNGHDTNSSADWQPDSPSDGQANPCRPPPDTPTPTFTQGPSPTPSPAPTPHPTVEPMIQLAGFGATDYRLDRGGTITFLAYITDPEDDITHVSVVYAGETVFELQDDGMHGDFGPGDDIYGFELAVPPFAGECPDTSTFRLLFRIVAEDAKEYFSVSWPYFHVGGETATFDFTNPAALPVWEQLAARHANTPAGSGTGIFMAGYMLSRASSQSGGTFNLAAVTSGNPDVIEIELFYSGSPTGIFLKDDGASGDFEPGDGVFGIRLPLNPGEIPPGDYFFQLQPTDSDGNTGDLWPYLTLCE
ncbi:lamin tail domain-containing protein [bacterium]|nr:lamin tail domain-containing protein [candidate division CSSED10-310 bacterium]